MSFFMLAYAVERVLFFARVEVSDFADPHGLQVALTRHLTVLASIASNAPYIGLLGTVLGILITFHDLSSGAELSASAVMLGLALALKATAAGLVVAIPATLIYNGLVRRVDVLTARWNSLQHQS
jgi:biopolymer transport protein ExbB